VKISSVQIYDCKIRPRWNPVVVRVQTDEGISGVGEVALAYGVGSDAAIGMVRNLAERFLIGVDPFQVDRLWELMYRRTFWGQGGGPIVYGGMSAIDEALLDIKGKALGVPAHDLLGGRCWETLRVYANGWSSGCGTPEQCAEAALRVAADGYTAMKFDPFYHDKSGARIELRRALDGQQAELAYQRVRAVRDAVGPAVDILVEVHGNLGTTSAIHVGKRLEEFRPFFYEEPVDALNVECMRKVAENVDIPIAAGERLYTRYGFRQYIEGQVLDILQPDIGLAGGISETKRIAAYAETYNLHVQPHNCAGPIATAAALQLDACIPNFIIQEIFPYRDVETYQLVQEAYDQKAVGSHIPVPDAPGLGVELDEDVVARYPCIQVD
jgi:galactonate dehydratase